MFCSSVAVLRSNLKVLFSLFKCEKELLKVVERKKNENMGVTRRSVRHQGDYMGGGEFIFEFSK